MASYVEDIIQNIYTKCDMKGLDELNQGLQDAIWYSGELHKNLKDANQAQREGFDFHARAIERSKEAYKVESLRQKLNYEQARFRQRLAEQQEKIDERRQRRQDRYNKSLNSQNWLLRRASRLFFTYFSIRTLKGIIDTTTRMDLLQKSLYGLTKSTQDWQYVQNQAFATGTKFETVAKGYRNFFSAARMAGFDKSNIQDMYSGILLSSRAIGASPQQTEGALLALEQMLSKGTVSMEELRRQLGNAIPGAFEIAAKSMNMTTKEFNDFVKKGQLASNIFVPKFVKALVDEYGGGMEQIRKSTSFALTNLENAWVKLQMEFMSGRTGQEFAKAINELTEFLTSDDVIIFIQQLSKLFRLIIKMVTWTIRHIAIIGVLVGAGGLAGALKRLGDIGFNSFVRISKESVKFYGRMLLLVAVLGMIQDLIYGIFLPDKTDSVTEDILRRLGLIKPDQPTQPFLAQERAEEELKYGVVGDDNRVYFRNKQGELRRAKWWAATGENWNSDKANIWSGITRNVSWMSRPVDKVPSFTYSQLPTTLEKNDTFAPTIYAQPTVYVVGANGIPTEDAIGNATMNIIQNSIYGAKMQAFKKKVLLGGNE